MTISNVISCYALYLPHVEAGLESGLAPVEKHLKVSRSHPSVYMLRRTVLQDAKVSGLLGSVNYLQGKLLGKLVCLK